MSCQPNPQTHDIAHEYLHRPPPEIVDQDRLLSDEIMADPFEGDHWGTGYDSEVKEGWTDSDSSGDDRDEHEKIVTPLRERVGIAHAQARVDTEQEGESGMREAEERMRRLGEGYWSTGGKLVEVREVGEGWRAVSTGLSVASLVIAIDGDAKLGVKVDSLLEHAPCWTWLIIGSYRSAGSERITIRPIRSTWAHARFLPRWKVLRKCFSSADAVQTDARDRIRPSNCHSLLAVDGHQYPREHTVSSNSSILDQTIYPVYPLTCRLIDPSSA